MHDKTKDRWTAPGTEAFSLMTEGLLSLFARSNCHSKTLKNDYLLWERQRRKKSHSQWQLLGRKRNSVDKLRITCVRSCSPFIWFHSLCFLIIPTIVKVFLKEVRSEIVEIVTAEAMCAHRKLLRALFWLVERFSEELSGWGRGEYRVAHVRNVLTFFSNGISHNIFVLLFTCDNGNEAKLSLQ